MSDERPVVANSGPLIVLAGIQQLDLVRQLYGTILVPDAVFNEVTDAGVDRPGARELLAAEWARRTQVYSPPDPVLLKDLGPGEAEAITLAVQSRARLLIIDDLKGRRVAALAYGLKVKGAAGVLVAAKRAGFVAVVRPLLEEMRRRRYYMTEQVLTRTLSEAGEL